jgi:hypothetical protein
MNAERRTQNEDFRNPSALFFILNSAICVLHSGFRNGKSGGMAAALQI